jgi:putative spermidine/putrescine transport system permease protein
MVDAVATRAAQAPRSGPLVSAKTWLFLACLPILIFLFVPILIVIPMAFTKGQILMFPPEGLSTRPFTELFNDRQWMESAVVSLKIAILATVLATLVGSAAAVALHKSKIPLKGLITTIILLPLMIPAIVLALGYYLFFLQFGQTGRWTSIALAHSVAITPYVFVAVQASLAGLDPALARAARSLGGGALAVLYHVYWPTIRPGVIGGAIFAFIGSFDEIVIAMFLAGPSVVTLPVQMFNSLQMDLTPKLAAVSALLFLLSVVGFLAQALQATTKAKQKRMSAGR